MAVNISFSEKKYSVKISADSGSPESEKVLRLLLGYIYLEYLPMMEGLNMRSTKVKKEQKKLVDMKVKEALGGKLMDTHATDRVKLNFNYLCVGGTAHGSLWIDGMKESGLDSIFEVILKRLQEGGFEVMHVRRWFH